VGKIVKGAHESATRYALEVPVIAPPALPLDPLPADDFAHDDYGFNNTFSPGGHAFDDGPAPYVPEPSIDRATVREEAQALIDMAAADAEALLTDAHERARTMIEDSAARAEQIAENTRRAAHDEGYAHGMQSAELEMSELLATMRNLIEMARAERHKIIETAEPEIVRLAMGIAERVLHQQVALDRNVVVEMAKAAISRLLERDAITVRVNPADLERMREHREDVLALGDVKNLRIIEDQRVDRGGVLVETDAGSVDARISTQVAEAKRVLHIEEDVILQPPADVDGHDRSLRAV
jgi:flagellar assembly protein FliH